MPRVAVIGGGPAGCVFAARMAQLGHHVTLIERLAFPRSRLGESLSAGVLPMLEAIGARPAVERAGFPRIQTVTTAWDADVTERHDPHARGLLVDRGRFDALLLNQARAHGVCVMQPAKIRHSQKTDCGWQLGIESGQTMVRLEVDFLADASGRRGFLRRHRVRQQPATIALYAYWQGAGLPSQPRIEAGTDAWYWGVPLPDGRCNLLVFLDATVVRRERGRPLMELLCGYLEKSRLLSPSGGGAGRNGSAGGLTPVGPALAIDATPFLDHCSVTTTSIKVGDAALALDPLSSSGVQKAIQTALSSAIVANTLLRKPDMRDAAMQFYRTSLQQAATRHAGWAAAQYARVAARGGGPFWASRALGATPDLPADGGSRDAARFTQAVQLSAQLEFVETPCLDGEFVTLKRAVSHPLLDEPVAYVGPWPLEPLLRDVRGGMTPLDLARVWSDRLPLRSGLQVAAWLLDRGLLV